MTRGLCFDIANEARARFGAHQRADEFAAALAVVAELRPETVLEIGSASGGSLYGWAQVAHPEAHIISVDCLPWRSADVTRETQRLTTVMGRSGDARTYRAVVDALEGRPLEFLFVDGEHTAGAARWDIETYGALVRPGGMIGMHDIDFSRQGPGQMKGIRSSTGTMALNGEPLCDCVWRELKARYPSTVEIVCDSGTGIGLALVMEGR